MAANIFAFDKGGGVYWLMSLLCSLISVASKKPREIKLRGLPILLSQALLHGTKGATRVEKRKYDKAVVSAGALVKVCHNES